MVRTCDSASPTTAQAAGVDVLSLSPHPRTFATIFPKGALGSLINAQLSMQAMETCPPSDGVGMALIALRNARSCVKVLTGGHLVLSALDGSPLRWPCATNTVLYLRQCYAPLYEIMFQSRNPMKNPYEHKHIVTGQPGIGKSVFGCV